MRLLQSTARDVRQTLSRLRLLAVNTAATAAGSKQLALEFVQLFDESLDFNHCATAIEKLRIALSFPDNAESPELWCAAAKLYVAAGEYDTATQLFLRTKIDFPRFEGQFQVRCQLGGIFRCRQMLEDAVDEFRYAVLCAGIVLTLTCDKCCDGL